MTLLLLLHLLLGRRRQRVGTQIEAEERKMDGRVDLLGTILALAHLKALEVDNEVQGRAGDRNLFGCLAFTFAEGTFPHLVFGETFFLGIGTETVMDVIALFAGGPWNLD